MLPVTASLSSPVTRRPRTRRRATQATSSEFLRSCSLARRRPRLYRSELRYSRSEPSPKVWRSSHPAPSSWSSTTTATGSASSRATSSRTASLYGSTLGHEGGLCDQLAPLARLMVATPTTPRLPARKRVPFRTLPAASALPFSNGRRESAIEPRGASATSGATLQQRDRVPAARHEQLRHPFVPKGPPEYPGRSGVALNGPERAIYHTAAGMPRAGIGVAFTVRHMNESASRR